MSAKTRTESSLVPPPDDGIVELSLMLSRRQFEALEERARADGMSVAQFLRRLVRESILQEPAGEPF